MALLVSLLLVSRPLGDNLVGFFAPEYNHGHTVLLLVLVGGDATHRHQRELVGVSAVVVYEHVIGGLASLLGEPVVVALGAGQRVGGTDDVILQCVGSLFHHLGKAAQTVAGVAVDIVFVEVEVYDGQGQIALHERLHDVGDGRNFGGLCLARKDYEVGENHTSGRATAWETVEFIDSLIVCAINEPGFIWNIPDSDQGQWSGRLTRASARALRAKVWMFAASPLFNNKEPYMDYTPDKVTEFTNIEHVWFGREDPSLWNRCLQYCEDFFNDNAANGNYYALIQPTSQNEAGYRTAYRRAYRYRNDATNHEKLFDAHPTLTLSDGGWGWGWRGFALDCYRQGGAVPTNELMECFGMADGRNFPYENLYGPGKNPQGIDMFADRDPRLYETMLVPRQSLPAGFDYAGFSYVDSWENGAMFFDAGNFGDANGDDNGSHYRKFKWMLDYTNGRMDDEYIGVAYTRLAEMYLIRAEAKAETGNLRGALDDIHVVRSRVGLGRLETMNPQLNLTSNKENLINEILRERNCEIGAECGDRLYDMVRRKRVDLFTKPLHEIRVYRLDENGQRLPLKNSDNQDIDLRWDPSTPWPKFEYEKPQIVNGARRWWDWEDLNGNGVFDYGQEPGFWTNKWLIDPVSRIEVQKGYGLTQNPGW